MRAAEAGQGDALARSLLVADAIEAGVLAGIGKASLATLGSYYLISSMHCPDSAFATVFRQGTAGQIGPPGDSSLRAIIR